MAKLYIIAGCNGAGKTTASFTILPEVLDCKEFVNADEIARGLSPFQPEKVAVEAGRIMLSRIRELINDGENFAFETTLSSKVFDNYLREAKQKGFETILLFFWLNKVELAVKRVGVRVSEGGHNIPIEVIKRRYHRGLYNFFKFYKDSVDSWMFVNNSGDSYKEIAQGTLGEEIIFEKELWDTIRLKYGTEQF